MENLMVHFEFLELVFRSRERSFNFPLELCPLSQAPKIVRPQDSAVEQILSEWFNLLVAQEQGARLDHIDPRIIEQSRVGEADDAPIGIGLHRGDLLEPEGEVQ